MSDRAGFIATILFFVLLLGGGYAFFSLSKVEAGYVGVKVNLLGSNKGVDSEVLGVGRYWIGWNQELYKFPTFQQTAAWSKPSDPTAGAFQFQSKEGLSLSADVSMSYKIDPEKVHILFQTYRRGLDEITDVYLYNSVRDTMVQYASSRTAENLYGEGKAAFIADVTAAVREKMKPVGIDIDYIAIVGNVWLPAQVKQAIDAKVQAGQLAAQRETEVATAKAEAEKAVATAEGEARSRKAIADANAYVVLQEAKAQKQANEMLAKSITPELIEYNKMLRWDGKMPQVVGNNTPLLNIR
jgi:regulator of protease activity HflC (stomatin/prohibitin superfamily)